MSTIQLKEELHQYIDKADDRLLNIMLAMLEAGFKSDGHISIEQYNIEIDEAEAEIDRGEFTTHEELKREMKEW